MEYVRLFERKTTSGGMYIAAKTGLIIQAVIMPENLPNENLMDLLKRLTDQCWDAMEQKRLKRTIGLDQEQSTLFRGDESTGEIIGEGARENE